MRLTKCLMVGLIALALATGSSFASVELNEVGAFLVYPAILAGTNANFETYVSVINTGPVDVFAHAAYIDGREEILNNQQQLVDNDEYCYECNFNIPLTPNDTELLVIRAGNFGGIDITSEDGTVTSSCIPEYGMLTLNLESPIGTVITDNYLFGSQITINYAAGWAYSIPAIPFQGQNGGNGDRQFDFDGVEYSQFPSVIAGDFIAPDFQDSPLGAFLVLFTLGFEAEFPPFSHCEIEGYDAAENPFSRSFNFGCWLGASLGELHPEFWFGNLGQQSCDPTDDDDPCDTHGWFKLDCDVTAAGGTQVAGGVHGVLVQVGATGAAVRRNADDNSPTLANAAAWARTLYQSGTVGGNVTYHLAGPGGGF